MKLSFPRDGRQFRAKTGESPLLTPDPSGAVPGPVASLVGALIAEKYRLRRLVGRGGMGTVYKAENVAIGRTVALKILHPHLADDAIALARFQREARAAASIGHENIVEILDMGLEPSGACFLVMEYVRGKSLQAALREGGPFPVERAAHVAGQALAALAAAHREGILHRDLKPDNVLLSARSGRAELVKLFDFGLAAFVDAARDPSGHGELTPSGRAMGTPTYASPEQLLGTRARDARVDLYAVGVLLFEMLAGRPPFVAWRFPELCRAITTDPPPTFASLGVAVPPALEAVVQRALAKRPAARFESAEAMIEALIPFGAAPLEAEVEATDTLTMELREVRARELLLGGEQVRQSPTPVVRGEVLAALLEFAEGALDPAGYAALLATDPGLGRALRAGLVEDALYPGGFLRVLEQIDRDRGRGDRRLLAEAGRHLARRAFVRRDKDLLLRSLTPELFFSLVPELWVRYFAAGEARVVKVGRGYGRVEIGGMPDAFLARSVAIAGYLDEGLRMAGARDVDVRLASSAALGDPMDVFEAAWSS